jgi:hypothetical protein
MGVKPGVWKIETKDGSEQGAEKINGEKGNPTQLGGLNIYSFCHISEN